MEISKLLIELDKLYEHKPIRMRGGLTLTKYFHSYRGDYYQLAIGYTDEPFDDVTVKDLKNLLDEALYKESMTGYKGGEFPITEDTDVVLANWGTSEGYFIAEFIEREDDVYMATGEI